MPHDNGDITAHEIAGGRYLLEETIGQGGMAVVYRALDRASGRHVALKLHQPPEDDTLGTRARELFEREFHTLAQLAHPRIVTAFDYGIDEEAPYYTMELLDGGDLVERAPMPWRDACAVARDVCSALSLVHSRKMVYRDLSPRNVRCTSDGKAKLIDFGAMAPMGATRAPICTPIVAAPEVAHQQPLDGRSDLYALGSTLYYTLVGRSPYPARRFADLDSAWKTPPLSPSHWIAEIPKALDALVMDLLQLDAQMRPANAAEVSRRLAAIAGLETEEELLSSQAYLTTPNLVARAPQIRAIKKALHRIDEQGKGGAFLVRAPSGAGKTRFLDACILQAKLAGLRVLRAAPADAPDGAHAAAQAFASTLMETMPAETVQAALPHREALEPVLPALRGRLPDEEAPSSSGRAPAAQAALRSFLLDIADQKPLLVAIDDFERFDVESQALGALLARAAPEQPLIVVAAASDDAPAQSDTMQALSKASAGLKLQPLTAEQTRHLLISVFGDVPNLEGLARKLHTLAGGNPQNLMRLAQHLLDRGTVHCDAGAWVLPERIDDAELPATMAQALQDAAAGLTDGARSLARAMAEWPEQRFTMNECLMLTGHDDNAAVFGILDELSSASVITPAVDGYVLGSKAWSAALSGPLEPQVELRLARVLQQRGDGLRAARHLFQIGHDAEGLGVLLAHAEESIRKTDASVEEYVKLLSTLPADWMQIYRRGMELCEKHGRSARERYVLENRMAGILSQSSTCSEGQLAALAQKLARAAGLDVFASLDPTMDPGKRLQQAMGEAGARYAQTPENDRLFDPGSAIQPLARVVVAAVGNFSRTMDAEEWQKMPSLTPLVPLSPAIALVDGLARGFDARLSGRFEEACAIYRALLQKLEENAASLDETYAKSIRAHLTIDRPEPSQTRSLASTSSEIFHLEPTDASLR